MNLAVLSSERKVDGCAGHILDTSESVTVHSLREWIHNEDGFQDVFDTMRPVVYGMLKALLAWIHVPHSHKTISSVHDVESIWNPLYIVPNW